MTKRLYHINPATGVPSVCRAEKGKCPFGEKGDHYPSFSEAQKAYDNNMKNVYGLLPTKELEEVIEKEIKERLTLKPDKLKEFMTLPITQRAKEAYYTEDQDLLNGIIKGEFDERSWSVTGPALQNKNISKDFLLDVLIRYPKEYSSEAKMWAASNTGLRSRDIGYLYLNSGDDDVKAVSLLNKNLDKRFISGILKRMTVEEASSYPHSVIFMDSSNNHIPIVAKMREQVLNSREYRESYEKANSVYKEYMDYGEKMKSDKVVSIFDFNKS